MLVTLFATVICYNFAFANQAVVKQKIFGPTKVTDTLSIIAKHVIPPRSTITLNQVMVAIYANNISAFGKGNMNLLLKNKWLKLPSTQEIKSISPTQAFLIVKRHEIAWHKNEALPQEYIHIRTQPELKTVNQLTDISSSTKNDVLQKENVLAQAPPEELMLPFTPLLRPVTSLNFVFVSSDELQRVQKDKLLPLILKPSVIAQQIQVLAQEPMSALQTFDMWTLLSTQFQELAIRFDKIEKDQNQIQQQLGALKQNDVKQARQIQALQEQLQHLAPAKKDANSNESFVGFFIKEQTNKLVEFFKTLDSVAPIWPLGIALFATSLLLIVALHRYRMKKKNNLHYQVAKEQSSEPIAAVAISTPITISEPEPKVNEVRIRAKEGSLHEAVAEILSSHHSTPEVAKIVETVEFPETTDADFSVEDEISSLLDLARAYSDMGDHENARSLLDRIITEGSDAQRQDAKHLLEQMQP